MQHFPNKLSFLAAACLFGNVIPFYSVRANGYSRPTIAPLSSTLPLNPRLFIDGSLGGTNVTSASQNRGFLYADAMVPVYGNPEGFEFLDVTAKWGSDHGWLGSIGAGIRRMMNDEIFGGYLFAEYDRTNLGNLYWTVVPGLEWMSPNWDLHLNGYFPVGNKDNVTGIFFGSQLGVTCPTFHGHQQFDQIYNSTNEVGPGMDLQIGYIIPNFRRTRVFGAGYYYWFEHTSNIRGGAVGIEIPMTRMTSLLFRDSYDNISKNTALFTLRVYFDGIEKYDENDVSERMLDPIERHVGVLYTGSGIPAQQTLYDTGQLKLQRDNIWFFRPGGSTDATVGAKSCTYEMPCDSTLFTQANINTINSIESSPNFYLTHGGYAIGPITLPTGGSIFGRTADFCQIANINEYPILNGNITLVGGSNTLQAFQLLNSSIPANNPSAGIGINVLAAQNILIDRVIIGSNIPAIALSSIPSGNFKTGISLSESSATVTNSVINAGDFETQSSTAIGIYALESTINLQKDIIQVHAYSQISSPTVKSIIVSNTVATGVQLINSDANVSSSTINVLGDEVSTISMCGGSYATCGVYIRLAGMYAYNYNSKHSLISTNNIISSAVTGRLQSNDIFMGERASTYGIKILSNGAGTNTSLTSKGDTILMSTNLSTSGPGGRAQVTAAAGISVNSSNGGYAVANTFRDNTTINTRNISSNYTRNSLTTGLLANAINANSTSIINSQGDIVAIDIFNMSGFQDVFLTGNAGIFATSGTNGSAIVNANGDIFNLQSIGIATAFNYTFPLSAVEVIGPSTVNITNRNIFTVTAFRNGVPFTVSQKSGAGTLNSDGTNIFNGGPF
jgi:hypothetical protein